MDFRIQQVRREIPYISWQDFLKLEAGKPV